MVDFTIIIPTYKKRIESHNLLPELLESIKSSNRKNFNVIILNNTPNKKSSKKIEIKINAILKPYKKFLKLNILGYKELNLLYEYFRSHEYYNFSKYIHFNDYSAFRNIGLLAAQIIDSPIVIFIDDDEIIKDKDFLKKATEFVGKTYKGKFIGGITGYYINPDGSHMLHKNNHWWAIFWNKGKYMNRAFKIIENKKRLNETTFALGGVLVLHRDMFRKVLFDPFIQRGEDMDILINAKCHGFAFLLDNQLGINHFPQPKSHSKIWMEIRKDTYRFIYKRKKILQLIKDKKLEANFIDSLDPYPGQFLKPSIYMKLILTSFLKGLHSIFNLKFRDAMENFKNIKISLIEANIYANKNCRNYFQLQEKWSKLMSSIVKDKALVKYFNDKFK